MTDKHFPVFYSVLLGFFTSIMMILMILLFVEYRFFCRQVDDLSLLKQQYNYYIEMLDKKINDTGVDGDEIKDDGDEPAEEMTEESSIIMDELTAAESSDAPDDDDEYADDFVVINRHPDYLKQSTLDYIESQELNALMTAIDIDRWSDYAPSIADKSKSVNKKVQNKSAITAAKTVGNAQKKEQKNSSVGRAAKDCGFIWPIDSDKFWLSSLFGPRKRIDGSWGFHHGVDMAAVKGTVVKSARAGVVVEAAFQAGYGNTVVVKHSESLKTRYAHLHTIRVHVGQKIKQTTIVGTVGETGFIRKKGKDGSHLHFEVYEYGKRINPLQCLPRVT
jgi:murein DD-endopeptidase MepM/ murein hydrolase activator NlpD